MESDRRSEPRSPGSPSSLRRTRRRERHGRGLRGVLASRPIPLAQTRSQTFDAMVLHAVGHLRPRLATELAQLEFAVQDVPAVTHHTRADYRTDDDILDDDSVPISRIYRDGITVAGSPGQPIKVPVIVIYRRPLESRAQSAEELADLVHDVVVEQVARLLGRSPEEIDGYGFGDD